jgi:hypothetical protein
MLMPAGHLEDNRDENSHHESMCSNRNHWRLLKRRVAQVAEGLWFMVQGLGFVVNGLGVYGPWFRVQASLETPRGLGS